MTVVVARDGARGSARGHDDGPGLPPGLGDQIFSRFVRGDGPADLSRDAGTGLGLAIVRAVAASHGGRVETGRSAAGGASFAIHLPLRESSRSTGRNARLIL